MLRRGRRPQPLVVALVLNGQILKVTADGLSRILQAYNSKLRKNSSKTQKIRTICKIAVVKELVPAETLQELERKCDEMDAARRKRASQGEAEDEDDENMEVTRPLIASVLVVQLFADCFIAVIQFLHLLVAK